MAVGTVPTSRVYLIAECKCPAVLPVARFTCADHHSCRFVCLNCLIVLINVL